MVYVLLADGFEEIEAVTPVDLLRRAGVDVTTVGITGPVVKGGHGMSVIADTQLHTASLPKDCDMLVLPGGGLGTKNLEASSLVQALIDEAVDAGLWVAAICAAPSILGHKGLLKGHTATIYPGMADELTGADAVVAPVVTSDKFITSMGAGTAIAFSGALITALKGKAVAQEILTSIVYNG